MCKMLLISVGIFVFACCNVLFTDCATKGSSSSVKGRKSKDSSTNVDKEKVDMEMIKRHIARLEEKMAKNEEEIGQLREKNAILESQLAQIRENGAIEWCTPSGNKWSDWDLRMNVSGLMVTRVKGGNDWATVFAEQPFLFPKITLKRKIAYFEVKIVEKKAYRISFGLRDAKLPLRGIHLGEGKNSFGFYSSGEIWTNGNPIRYESGYGTGDVVGCGLYKAHNAEYKIFFTKNGQPLGKPIHLPATVYENKLFPAVSIYGPGDKIEAIFDKNLFKYNLANHWME